jgi:hypothetical protein
MQETDSLEESMPDKKQQQSIHFNVQQQIGCEAFATIPFCVSIKPEFPQYWWLSINIS